MASAKGQRAIMAAVSPEGAIGLGGTIPWHYRGDMRRVKRLTMGTTLIMGRVTWESLASPRDILSDIFRWVRADEAQLARMAAEIG